MPANSTIGTALNLSTKKGRAQGSARAPPSAASTRRNTSKSSTSVIASAPMAMLLARECAAASAAANGRAIQIVRIGAGNSATFHSRRARARQPLFEGCHAQGETSQRPCAKAVENRIVMAAVERQAVEPKPHPFRQQPLKVRSCLRKVSPCRRVKLVEFVQCRWRFQELQRPD